MNYVITAIPKQYERAVTQYPASEIFLLIADVTSKPIGVAQYLLALWSADCTVSPLRVLIWL